MASNVIKVVINNQIEYELEVPDDEMPKLEELFKKFAVSQWEIKVERP